MLLWKSLREVNKVKNRLVIIGAGGHGKVIADIAVRNNYTNIVFLDDNAKGMCLDFPIIGTCANIESLNDGRTDFVIAIGNNKTRKIIAEKYDVNWVVLIHPTAQIGLSVNIDKGTVVMANAVINASASIGKHCIINTASVIEHDNIIADYVHVSPNATLGGTVQVGECTHIGIGAVVRNNTDICSNCVIGAGAVVIKNIYKSAIYVGIPVNKIL